MSFIAPDYLKMLQEAIRISTTLGDSLVARAYSITLAHDVLKKLKLEKAQESLSMTTDLVSRDLPKISGLLVRQSAMLPSGQYVIHDRAGEIVYFGNIYHKEKENAPRRFVRTSSEQ